MEYGKIYLTIFLASSLLAAGVIINISSLDTTWLGIYNPEGNIQFETRNEYSSTFFKKSSCESWVKERKEKDQPGGVYVCGKNCEIKGNGLIDCDKIYRY